MVALLPPVLFVVAVVSALAGMEPPGASDSPPLDERLLLWTLYLSFGWAAVGGSLAHTVFAKRTAKAIGWESNPFQYEVGFSGLARGLASIYAVHSGSEEAWVAVAIAGSIMLLFAGFLHISEMRKERNFNPGNTAILISDFGAPIVVIVTLISVGAV